jgi:hypothetical protein
MISKYRFIAYTPFGAALGQLTHPSSWKFGPTYNEVPGMTMNYRDDAANADRLFSVCEVAAEYSVDGTTWVEPPNARFLRLGRGRVIQGQDQVRKYTLPGIGHLLKKAAQWVSTGLNADGKRPFNSANAGTILKTLIDENKTFGGSMTGITYDFTTTLDSNGQAWNKIITIAYEPGLDLYTILDNLANQGMVDWHFQGRQLRVFNTTFLDVVKPVTFAPGIDVNGIPVDASIDGLVHSAVILGDAGVRVNLDTTYSPPQPWGKWQASISNSGVSDPGTMLILAGQLLEDGSKEKIQYTLEIVPERCRWEPFRDFLPGHRVTSFNEAGNLEDFRVYAIEVERDAAGKLKVAMPVNDRFVESEVNRAKRVNGISGGAVAGGSGTRPAPPAPAGRIPATPVGLVVTSTATPNEAGFPRAVLTADWADVTTDNSGVALAVASYDVQAFPGVSSIGTVWGSSERSAFVKDDLVPGSTWQVQVRAVSETGIRGAWSTKVSHTTETDTTPPGVPTVPVLSSSLGTITIRWDGKAVGGVNMPPDLDYVKVWQQGVTAFVDRIERGGGYVTIAGLTPGASLSFALSAIDMIGNESAKTSYVAQTVTSAATDAGIQAELDAVAADIEADVGNQITTATNGLNKIFWSTATPLSPAVPGTRAGDLWNQRNGTGQIIGQWEWSGSVWNARTLESAIIANLDAGKVSFGEMDGLRIKAGTIRAGALSVGLQDNLVVDSALLDPTLRANRAGNGWAYDATTKSMQSTTVPQGRLSMAAGGLGDAYTDLIVVEPGERYLCTMVAYSSIGQTVQFAMQGYDAVGAANASVTVTTPVAVSGAVDTTVGQVFTVPANMYFMNVGAQFTSASGSTRRIRNFGVVKQVEAVVIADGAITAPKIAANAIVANNIQAGAIDGMVITGPTIRTAVSPADRVELTTTGVRLFKGVTLKTWMSTALGQLRLYGTGDVSLTSTGHGLQMGDDDGLNMAIDANEIMTRDGGGPSTLFLNREGGSVLMGGAPGGFTDGDVVPANDDNRVVLIGAVQIQNTRVTHSADEFSPLMIGPRGSFHLFLSSNRVGASSGDGMNRLYLNPRLVDESHHNESIVMSSDSIAIQRLTSAANASIKGWDINHNVALQFFEDRLVVTNNASNAFKSIGASAFTVASQTDTKRDRTDIENPLAIVQAAKSQKWRYLEEIEEGGRWHYGPMLEDLPPELSIAVGESISGYDVGSMVGLLWEIVRVASVHLKAVEDKAEDILVNHKARLDALDNKATQAQTALTNLTARVRALETR